MSGSIRICRFWRSRSHRFIFYSSDDTELIRRFPAGGDYSRIFADATCSVDTDTPEVVKSPTDFTDIHRFFVGGFGHADFADDADFSSSGIFIHRMTRNLFGDFLPWRLLMDFRGCDLFGRYRYPLRSDKAIHQRSHKKSVKICGICGT